MHVRFLRVEHVHQEHNVGMQEHTMTLALANVSMS